MAKLFSVKGNYYKAQTQKDKDLAFNKMLKKWKKKFEEAEIKEELISRKEFVKPSLQRRVQKQQAIRENQREVQLKKQEDGRL